MAFTRADLQAFYRMGFKRGYATWYADPTDDEINEFFKGAYKAWCDEGERDRPKRKKLESKLNYLEHAQPFPLPECEELLNRQREYTRKALQKMAGGGRVKP